MKKKLPFNKKSANPKKTKKGARREDFILTIIRAGNRRKSGKIKKFARKKGKNSPSGKKGLPKKKRRGKKGHIKNYALQKKRAHQKKRGAEPFFFKVQKISPSFDIA